MHLQILPLGMEVMDVVHSSAMVKLLAEKAVLGGEDEGDGEDDGGGEDD